MNPLHLYCPHAGQAFTFLFTFFNFICVHELIPLCGIRFLDEKSKQKNQEKIIPAFAHNALRLAAIFSGHRAYDS